MLGRLFRPGLGARAARIAAEHGGAYGQTVTVQRVRLFRARNIARSLLISGTVTFVCWHLYSTAVINPLIKHLEQEYASLSLKEKREIAKKRLEQDSSIFIAMPFTTQQIESPPYKGSDPEWKKFGEISKDKPLQERIRNDLAGTVKNALSKHPMIVKRCGSNMTLRRYWLDIDFPYKPSPTFEQYGILIDNDGIFWASEPIESITVQRMNKILWPTAMAQSSWAFTSAMVKQHWNDVKRGMGFGSPSDTPPSLSGPHPLSRSNLPSPGRQTADGTPADAPDSAVSKTADHRQPNDLESGGRTSFLKDMAQSHVDGARQMSNGPWMEFRKKLAQTWKPTKDYPPRGSIMVSGIVEIETPKSFVLVDVHAHWNPKLQKYDAQSMTMNVRRIQMKRQSPAPG